MHAELFVSRVGERVWAALRDGGRTVEFRVEHREHPPRLGRIVKACVTRVVPAIQAAFVDIGVERDAFVAVSDLWVPGEDPLAIGSEAGPIQKRLAPGRELLVQISRESRSVKGDRVTCFVSLPGRFLVLLPHSRHIGVSRRIRDDVERSRLTEILRDLGCGRTGLVARTAARGAAGETLRAEYDRLLDQWQAIRHRAATALPPAVVHDEPPLGVRLLRDAPARGFERAVYDDAVERARAEAFVREITPAPALRIEQHAGSRSLFASHGLDDEVSRALRPRVWLPSGGSIVVEQTEALVSIDVNTAKSVHGDCLEDTSLQTNLEAAAEIARQLRLRDMGGIVVIDFVDMESEASRSRLTEAMALALEGDPARTKIVGLSEIGLLELTRKRARGGLHAALTEPCPTCAGQGNVLQPDVVAPLGRGQN